MVSTAGLHGRGFKCQRRRGMWLPFGLTSRMPRDPAAGRRGTVLRVPAAELSPAAIYHAATCVAHLAPSRRRHRGGKAVAAGQAVARF